MVSIRAKVTLRRRGNLRGHIQKIEKALAGPTAVKVGLPGGKTPADKLQIGVWNHFGTAGSGKGFSTPKGGGFGGPIPPRPFITVAMFRHRSEIRALLRHSAYQITVNGKPMKPELEHIGQLGADFIKYTISSGGFAPNSPVTVAIKGSSKPLVDKGDLRSSITWELDGASGVGMGFKGGSK